MAEKQHSAEKDLLKLIENPGEAEAAGLLVPVERTQKIPFFRRWQKKPSARAVAAPRLTLPARRLVLRVLFVLTICFLAYFVLTVVREYSKTRNTQSMAKFTYISEGREARSPLNPEEPADAPSDRGPVRNIFKAGEPKHEIQKREEASGGMGDYKLVGISPSADPQQAYAMVKNTRTNITFFLKSGDRLDGMELEKIQENRVVFNAKGKQVELR